MRVPALAILSLFAASPVLAEPIDDAAPPIDARPRLEAGAGLALVGAAPAGAGSVEMSTGWDGPRHDLTGIAGGSVALIPQRLYLVGGAGRDPGTTWRPYVGASLALTRDLAIGAVYKAEGFAEPEGEIELRLAAGHRFGETYLLANGIYGQDADGRDRDLEAAGAIIHALGSHVLASMTSRARFALGSMRDFHGAWDAMADLGAAVPIGRYAARAAAGVSALGTSRTSVGPLATLSLSTYF